MQLEKKALFLPAYQRLYAKIGPRRWWPARSIFEMMVGTILTQNTSWKNVEKAIGALRQKDLLQPRKMASLTPARLAELIRSSGYYNQKAYKLKALVKWFGGYGYSTRRVLSAFPRGQRDELRKELLSVHGVGPETADSILCYALKLPYFVVDTYTFRWLRRYAPAEASDKYEVVRERVEAEFRRSFQGKELVQHLNEFHALLVYLGKHVCTKKQPECLVCPLSKECAKNI